MYDMQKQTELPFSSRSYNKIPAMRDRENGGGEWDVKSPFQNGEI